MIKSLIKNTPVLGPLAVRGGRALGLGHKSKKGTRPAPYLFERLAVTEGDTSEIARRQLLNLLNYTKTSGSSYAARQYPAGYHTIDINGSRVQGQRDPKARLSIVPVSFEGKTVLDLGSNQGGMLFALDGIKWGVGIDYDSRMVNVANRIANSRGSHELCFYVMDLQKEPLEIIQDLLPTPRVDVVFLLSVCVWLSNWREVMEFASGISDAMLFESNGTDQQQRDQEQHLGKLYTNVVSLASASHDDPKQKRRRLYYCTQFRG